MFITTADLPPITGQGSPNERDTKRAIAAELATQKRCKERKNRIGFYMFLGIAKIALLVFLFHPKTNGLKLTKWAFVFVTCAILIFLTFFTSDNSWYKELAKDCSKSDDFKGENSSKY